MVCSQVYVQLFIEKSKIETPWKNIGYNLGIELAPAEKKSRYTTPEVVLKYGRSLTESGAHCWQEGMNALSIGLLVVGNFDKKEPSSEIWRFLVKTIREIQQVFPDIKILGHTEVSGVQKSCPGTKVNLEQLRKDVQKNEFA